MIVLLYVGCSSPVDAPEDFNELMSYLFLHTMTQESVVVEAGTTNLLNFSAENLDILREGYAIDNLSQASLDSTGADFPSLESVYGVALQYSVDFLKRSSDDLQHKKIGHLHERHDSHSQDQSHEWTNWLSGCLSVWLYL